MIINMIELMHLIKKRQADKPYIAQPFGSAIKYKRKELGLTLEEASEDICSISYLSKVENNAINPSEEYVEKFKDRFKLNDAFDYDLDTYKIHLNLIANAAINDLVIDRSYVEYYENRRDYQSVIITFAYHVLRQDYRKGMDLYHQLVSMISSMPQETFIMSMILTNYLFYYQMNYTDGLRVTSLIEKQEPLSENMTLLIQKWKLKYAFKLKHHHLIYKTYHKYEASLLEKHLFKQLKQLNFEKLVYEAKSFLPNEMKVKVENINSMDAQEKAFIISTCYYHHGDYKKALDISDKFQLLSNDWKVLHLLILDKMKKSDAIIKMIKNNVNTIDPLLALLVKHVSYKYLKEQNEILDYIKGDILSSKMFTDDHDILTYLMKDCEKILSSFQYYKDAVQTYRFFNRQLSQKI